MEGKKLADFISKVIKEKKGEEVDIINVKKFTVLADYFIICTSLVPEHGKSIAEEIEKSIKMFGQKITRFDRSLDNSWIALDLGDIIVHIMTEDKRKLYNIEKLWREVEPQITAKRSSK